MALDIKKGIFDFCEEYRRADFTVSNYKPSYSPESDWVVMSLFLRVPEYSAPKLT